jgi:hypothetical protein
LNAAVLLHWHYLIFLVPFGLASLLLLLSSMRVGHGHGAHVGHGHAVGHIAAHGHIGSGHAVAHTAAGHGPAHAASHVDAHHDTAADNHDTPEQRAAAKPVVPQTPVLLALLGAGRAPLPMVIEAFFMSWGMIGCIANQLLLKGVPSPELGQVLPAMGIAAGGGLVGARLAAELIARLMPGEESQIVSREGLYGLKGKVAFPVSETGGRIIVYDDFGSLHDETCRVVDGHPPIERGRRVLVMDRDSHGNLLVEEIPE